MDLAALMDEIGDVLDTVTGLRVHRHPPGKVVPPAAIVSYPERIAYDQTYRRGVDRIERMPVVLVVGKATDRAARDTVAEWSAGGGPGSIKALLEGHGWAACDVLTVTECSFDVVTIAAVDYLAAMFLVDIAGQGA
jgi:hypothetical protein